MAEVVSTLPKVEPGGNIVGAVRVGLPPLFQQKLALWPRSAPEGAALHQSCCACEAWPCT